MSVSLTRISALSAVMLFSVSCSEAQDQGAAQVPSTTGSMTTAKVSPVP